MNRCLLLLRAAWRTRSSALGARVRLGVRGAFCSGEFPLASPLPSIPSAAGCPALFGDFLGTMGLSDFPWLYIAGVRPMAFPTRFTDAIVREEPWDLPVPTRGVSVHAKGLRPR